MCARHALLLPQDGGDTSKLCAISSQCYMNMPPATVVARTEKLAPRARRTHHPAAAASLLPQLNMLLFPRELTKSSPSFHGCLVRHEEGGYRVLVAGAEAPLCEAAATHARSAASST